MERKKASTNFATKLPGLPAPGHFFVNSPLGRAIAQGSRIQNYASLLRVLEKLPGAADLLRPFYLDPNVEGPPANANTSEDEVAQKKKEVPKKAAKTSKKSNIAQKGNATKSVEEQPAPTKRKMPDRERTASLAKKRKYLLDMCHQCNWCQENMYGSADLCFNCEKHLN
ncbi:hypothetical protein EAF04_005592 [Stromatinia cepivora]|nr:hypothetical protein EAF04_005592 [Stromatinia cepivora]